MPLLLADGHKLALAHSGRHRPLEPERVEQLLGERSALLAPEGPVEALGARGRDDTFAGGATAAKATDFGEMAERAGV